MQVEIELFGALREMEPHGRMSFHIPDGATIADLRRCLEEHARGHWAGYRTGTLKRCAFADDASVLRDSVKIRPHGRVAVLMPVSGG